MDVPFDLWGQRGRPGVDVVGESHYADAIRDVFGAAFRPDGCELTTTAQLVPEPWNRHDPDAVAVWVGDRQVGYLPRHDAGRYAPVLRRLVAHGWLPQVAARLWAASDYRGRPGLTGSVRIDLAEPHLIAPVNGAPEHPHRLLPPGRPLPVTDFATSALAAGRPASPLGVGPSLVLSTLVGPEGERWAHVTLHELVEPLPGGSRSVLEVRFNGTPAGRLTPRMSAELLPAVRRLAAVSWWVAARALVKGPAPELTLFAARAHELPDAWLEVSPPAPSRGRAGVPNAPGHWDRIDAGNSAAIPVARSTMLNQAPPMDADRPSPHPISPTPNTIAPAVYATGPFAHAAGAAVQATGPAVQATGPNGHVAAPAPRPAADRGPANGGRENNPGPAIDPNPATAYPTAIQPPIIPAPVRTPVDPAAGRNRPGGDHTGVRARAAARVAVPAPAGAPAPARTPTPASTAARALAPTAASIPAPASTPAEAEHPPIPPRPAGLRFAVPPNWPQPPDGWSPRPGWHPNPQWPPAPPDWQWWLPYWE